MTTRLFTVFTLFMALILPLTVMAQGPQPPFLDHTTGDRMGTADTTQQQAQNVVLMGQVGGTTRAVAVQGNYVYMGVGPRLVILNVSDPVHPTVVGQTNVLPDPVWDVAVAGNYAYVAAHSGGLRIINVSNPAAPTEVGFYNASGWGWASGVTLVGNIAYVVGGRWTGSQTVGNLCIVNVANPVAPTEVGVCDTPGSASDVAVAGNYAYIAESEVWDGSQWVGGGLRIISIVNPVAPSSAGFYDTPGDAMGVAAAGNYAYVADGGSGLRVINVTDPAHPTESGFYMKRFANGVTVVGTTAYLADDYGLCIVNVSDPAHPAEVGVTSASVYGNGVAVTSNYAYVVSEYGNGLRVINISNPANPIEVGYYDTAGFPIGVAVVGSYVYFGIGEWDLSVVNVADPTNPTWAVSSHSKRGLWGGGTAVKGNYAYAARGLSGLRIFNVSNPMSPFYVGGCLTRDEAYDVAVVGNYAYVANGNGGLRIINIAAPSSPTEVGLCDTPGVAQGVAVIGDYAYVADGSSGLRIINIANPVAPSEVGFYDTPGSATNVAVAGNTVYIADFDKGLRIINVSDPAHPSEMGFFDTAGLARDVAVAGNRAYVADGSSGLRIINVTDPAHPFEVGFYRMGEADGVAVVGNYVYVGGWYWGLWILQFPPSTAATIPTGGGILASTFDQTIYTFGAGTFTDTVVVTHTLRAPGEAPSPGNLAGIGHFFDVTAVYSSTGQPAQPAPGHTYTVTAQYTDAEKGPAIESTLALYSWDGGQWVKEPSSVVDMVNNTVTATPNHFSTWAVLGETNRLYLPLVLRNY